MNERIRSQMNKVMSQASNSGYLQDAVITMRDGRYCLPVKAEAKNQVSGMIHDQSQNQAADGVPFVSGCARPC